MARLEEALMMRRYRPGTLVLETNLRRRLALARDNALAIGAATLS